MRLAAVAVATLALGCIDFRAGLACGADSDCLGYLCVDSVCVVPVAPQGTGGAGGGGVGGGNIVASGQTGAAALAQDETSLFWLVREGGHLKVRKAVKTATGTTELADLGTFSSVREPAMVVGPDALYVAAGREVVRVPKIGGAMTVLTRSTGEDFGGGVGIAGSTLVWLAPGSSATVWKMPVAGGAVVALAASELNAECLVASGTVVYWTATPVPGSSGAVISFDLLTNVRTLFSTAGFMPPKGLTINSDTVSWLESAPGRTDYRAAVTTQVGASVSSGFTVDTNGGQGGLRAAAPDGVQTLYAVSRGTDGSNHTGIFAIKTTDGTYRYEEAPEAGVASEVLVDAQNIYFLMGDRVVRRTR